MAGFIAVHVGAGYHAESLRPEYQRTCKKACIASVQKLQNGKNSIEAVTEAVSVLEDCPLTNAGIGSNLTLDGVVECDAGLMDGKSLNFGSVGALSNIQNPIQVAQKVLESQLNGLLPGGRIPPCTIVGTGAKDWALTQGFKFYDNNKLSTKSSEATYVKNLSLLENILTSKHLLESEKSKEIKYDEENILLDTVGAVCVDSYGNVSSAVSSGGLLLKQSGRIGQAAVYGAGCWAQNSSVYDKPSIACTVTGVGEYIIKTLFANKCYQMIYEDPNSFSVASDVFRNNFLDSPLLKNAPHKKAGVLTLKQYPSENYCDLSWIHNTKTMILGYMSAKSEKPITICSIQPVGANSNNIVGSEKCIRLFDS